MSKKIVQIKNVQDKFELTWVINNICTNHCDYCPPSLHRGSNHHYDWNIAQDFIRRILDQYPLVNCSISGGEPSLSPFLYDAVKMFHDAGQTVSITTNVAKKNLDYWNKISKISSHINISYHPAYHDKDFIKKVETISKNTITVVRIMMDTRYWDKSMDMYQQLKSVPTTSVEVVRVLPEMAGNNIGSDYTNEQLELLNKMGYSATILVTDLDFPHPKNKKHITNLDQIKVRYDDGTVEENYPPHKLNTLAITDDHRFPGWSCNIGLESLYIHYDGWIKKANCFQGGNLFHVNDHKNHSLPSAGEICQQNSCFCTTDLKITKTKIDLPQEKSTTSNRIDVLDLDYDNNIINPVVRIIPVHD